MYGPNSGREVAAVSGIPQRCRAVTMQSGLLATSLFARGFMLAVVLYIFVLVSTGSHVAARTGFFLLTILPAFRLMWTLAASLEDITERVDALEAHALAVSTTQACAGIWLGAVPENRTANRLARVHHVE